MRDQFEFLGIKSASRRTLVKGHFASDKLPPLAEVREWLMNCGHCQSVSTNWSASIY
nr:hypothetical protein [Vibrio mexicanus]